MPLKGRPPAGFEDWMLTVAELMQYEQMVFSLASQAAGKAFRNSAEEREAERSEAFLSVLRGVRKERHARLLEEITKEGIEAELWDVVKELRKEKQADKVFGPASLLVKMRGWAVETPDRPVLANLTQADIDKARAELKTKQEASEAPVTTTVPNGKPN